MIGLLLPNYYFNRELSTLGLQRGWKQLWQTSSSREYFGTHRWLMPLTKPKGRYFQTVLRQKMSAVGNGSGWVPAWSKRQTLCVLRWYMPAWSQFSFTACRTCVTSAKPGRQTPNAATLQARGSKSKERRSMELWKYSTWGLLESNSNNRGLSRTFPT